MPSTFTWIYLGTATAIDVNEGNTNVENASALVNTTWGSVAAPLWDRVVSATLINVGGNATQLDNSNNTTNDQFTTDIGAGVQTFTYDGNAVYNATLTYADGTTGTLTAVLVQSTSGHMFLAPEVTDNPDTLVLEAKPIRSIAIGTVVNNTNGLGIDRVLTGFDNGWVDGTAGADLINAAYVEPIAQGSDRIDNSDGLSATSVNDDRVRAGAGNDTVLAGLGNDSVLGGAGDDSLSGEGGNDTLRGEEGADVLSGGAGADLLEGGAGNDRLFGGGGADTLTGDEGDDSLVGEAGADSLTGGAGNDTLSGGTEADTLDAGDGADLSDGGAGDDLIYFGAGNDTVAGGDGNDTIDDAAGTTLAGRNLLDGGAGNDTIWAGFDADTLIGGLGRDLLYGEDGDDLLQGAEEEDTLWGGAGADTLEGGAAADQLAGEAGNDRLDGGEGADTLDGGAGNDTLWGGAAADSLQGGADRDLFALLTAGDAVDGGNTGDDWDILDLADWGKDRTNVVRTPSNPESGYVEFLDAFGVVIGTMTFSEIEQVIPCFTPGTRILTPTGERRVEEVRPGDLVITRDRGAQPVRWIGRRDLSLAELIARPDLRPVRIARGTLGAARDMLLSPQHRVLIEGARPEMLFGEGEVLAAALHLVGRPGVAQVLTRGVSYIHLLFDRHELVLSDGVWTESFQPAARSLTAMESARRTEIEALFPDLVVDDRAYPAARLSLKRHETAVLLAA
jgi:Ca2+-binding RTX toxin-like protein